MQKADFSTHRLLRHHLSSDERVVNSLFVSAFIRSNHLGIPNSAFLKKYYIDDENPDFYMLCDFLGRLHDEIAGVLELEHLVKMFENVVSPADRIVNGAIYTPFEVRERILHQCLLDKSINELQAIRLADISCGCGGFLMDGAKLIHEKTGKTYAEIYRENIFGIDIEDYAIERTKILLSLLALSCGEDTEFEFNLLCADTLDCRNEGFDERFRNFDVIVGNPPYVCSRNMTEETKRKAMAFDVCRYGHPDLYIPFIQIAIDSLNAGGRMGFITMNSFFNSLNGRGLREYLGDKKMSVEIVDFRGYQVFNSRSTYTCLLFVNNAPSVHLSYISAENGLAEVARHFEQIPYSHLNAGKGWNLRHSAYAAKIENKGVPLGKFCSSRHGIATLSNKTYIFMPQSEENNVYILENKGVRYPIERGICRDVVNSNKLNSDIGFDTLIEKVIFPYYIDDAGRAVVYSEEEMHARFPLAMVYLQSQRDVLAERDKGHTETYPTWYAYGRIQSLVMPRYKLFFPKIANKPLQCIIKDNPLLLLYNGMAFVSDDLHQLQILKCFMESKLFWEYVSSNAKPYASGFYSLNGVNIKKFGIPTMSSEEAAHLLDIREPAERDAFIMALYGL